MPLRVQVTTLRPTKQTLHLMLATRQAPRTKARLSTQRESRQLQTVLQTKRRQGTKPQVLIRQLTKQVIAQTKAFKAIKRMQVGQLITCLVT